jgi:hypothetical protein
MTARALASDRTVESTASCKKEKKALADDNFWLFRRAIEVDIFQEGRE